jgi:hypothetical protein
MPKYRRMTLWGGRARSDRAGGVAQGLDGVPSERAGLHHGGAAPPTLLRAGINADEVAAATTTAMIGTGLMARRDISSL